MAVMSGARKPAKSDSSDKRPGRVSSDGAAGETFALSLATPEGILGLQRTIGNHAVNQLLNRRALNGVAQRAVNRRPAPPAPAPAPMSDAARTFSINFQFAGMPPVRLANQSEAATLRALRRFWKVVSGFEQNYHQELADLEKIHEDQWIVGWISDHLSGARKPDEAIFKKVDDALSQADKALGAGDVKQAVGLLRQAAAATVDAGQQITAYREGSISGAGHAITVLEVTEAAGAAAATVATGGLAGAGAGLLATSGVAAATAGVYGMAQTGAQQVSEYAQDMRQHFDVSGLLKKGATDAATGFVGAFTGGALTKPLSRLFGSYLSAATPEFLEEMGKALGMAGPLPRDYFMTTGQKLIVEFLGGEATTPLTAAVTTVMQRLTGQSKKLPSAAEFTHEVFKEMVQGGALTLLTGGLKARYGVHGAPPDEEAGPPVEGAAPSTEAAAAGVPPQASEPTGVPSGGTEPTASPEAASEAAPNEAGLVAKAAVAEAPAPGGRRPLTKPGTRFRARDVDHALAIYNRLRRLTPTREAGIFQNVKTGEIFVVQGDQGSVNFPSGRDEWKLISHSHPNVGRNSSLPGTTPGEAAYVDRFASGSTGDFGVLVAQSQAAGGKAQSSIIHFKIPQGEDYTVFSYDPAAPEPFQLDYPGPNRMRYQKAFKSHQDYDAWVSQMAQRFHGPQKAPAPPPSGGNAGSIDDLIAEGQLAASQQRR